MALSDLERLLTYGMDAVDADNSIVEKQLAKMYKDSYKIVDQQIKDLYARLGDKMTLPEAQKYKRLEGVQKSIADEYRKLTGKALSLAEDTSAQNFTEAWYRSNWAMDQAIGTALSWGVLPVEAIRKSVYSEYSGLNIIQTFRKNSAADLVRIQSALTRGLATGAGYVKTARGISDAFEKGLWQALRVVRTETGRNFTEGQLKSYQDALDMGINVVKVWSSAHDERTRDAHGYLDGSQADKNGMFRSSNGGFGPGPGLMQNASDDINERCRFIERIISLPPEIEASRGATYVTFKDYAAPLGWTREKGWPKVKLV